MNTEEENDYLIQHFRLYEAQELTLAYARVMDRMMPHFVELATKRMVSETILTLFGREK